MAAPGDEEPHFEQYSTASEDAKVLRTSCEQRRHAGVCHAAWMKRPPRWPCAPPRARMTILEAVHSVVVTLVDKVEAQW